MKIRPLSNTGERRPRRATSLQSTAWGFPSVSAEVKTWRAAHFAAPKAHTPASPPQPEHRCSHSPAHSAKLSTASKRRIRNPQTATSFIFLWWTVRLQEDQKFHISKSTNMTVYKHSSCKYNKYSLCIMASCKIICIILVVFSCITPKSAMHLCPSFVNTGAGLCCFVSQQGIDLCFVLPN